MSSKKMSKFQCKIKLSWLGGMQGKVIPDRWMDYFANLLNETSMDESSMDESSMNIYERQEVRLLVFDRRTSTWEVKEALKRMKPGKAVGPDEMPIEAWKCLGKWGSDGWLDSLTGFLLIEKCQNLGDVV